VLSEKKSLCNTLFSAALFILLISRILVLTDNYNWVVSPLVLEVVYIGFVFFLILLKNSGKFVIRKGSYIIILLILIIHTVLWGTVFVNTEFPELIADHFKPQIMFVVLLAFNVLAVKQLHMELDYLKCAYYSLVCVLFWCFLKNISDVDLSGLANIMTATERTRANFGFGHYNTLGAACVCVILLRETIKKTSRHILVKILDYPILIVAVVMLLCSASRSALTSLILYFVVYYGMSVDDWGISSAAKKCIKIFEAIFILIMGVWVVFEVDLDAFLVAAQRSLLFTHTLPLFFESGRVLFGLGYASNVAYAGGLTPYTTYWMDNAYVYYLVTTGVVGAALLAYPVILIAVKLIHNRNKMFGRENFSIFCVYLYISYFEAMLFSAGAIVSYVYLPWLVMCFSPARKLG